MKLSRRQIELLERTARHPGRPQAAAYDRPAGEEAADADRVVRALEEAMWAIAHLDALAPTLPVTGWQPVATVPERRNVEVRVDDPLGPRSLPYPCRLVPGVGWIDATGNRKLTVEPVAWRVWPDELR